jgi:hypothetical protein
VRIDVNAIELGEIVVIQLNQPSDDNSVVVERLDHLYAHLLIMPRSIRAGAIHASAAATSRYAGRSSTRSVRHPAHAPRILASQQATAQLAAAVLRTGKDRNDR